MTLGDLIDVTLMLLYLAGIGYAFGYGFKKGVAKYNEIRDSVVRRKKQNL